MADHDSHGTYKPVPRHEHVVVRDEIGLLDHDSLEERIRRAEHDVGMPINGLGGRSHCWLCRRDYEERGGPR